MRYDGGFISFFLIDALIILYQAMQGRIEATLPIHKETEPLYIDSAYKALMRAERQTEALNKRTKVLQMNEQKVLKQCQNHQSQLERISNIREHHVKDSHLVVKAKKRQEVELEEQLKENQEQRTAHERQMSNVSLGRCIEKEKVREEIQKLRSLHQKKIQANRETQLQQKKAMRDKIQESIAASRVTLKNFYDSKHSQLVQGKQEEVRQLNKRRLQFSDNAPQPQMHQTRQEQLYKMKADLNKSTSTPQMRSPYQNSRQEPHPLVRRIDGVMDRYAKYL